MDKDRQRNDRPLSDLGVGPDGSISSKADSNDRMGLIRGGPDGEKKAPPGDTGLMDQIRSILSDGRRVGYILPGVPETEGVHEGGDAMHVRRVLMTREQYDSIEFDLNVRLKELIKKYDTGVRLSYEPVARRGNPAEGYLEACVMWYGQEDDLEVRAKLNSVIGSECRKHGIPYGHDSGMDGDEADSA